MGSGTRCSLRFALALALFGATQAYAANTRQDEGTLSTEPVEEMTLDTEPADESYSYDEERDNRGYASSANDDPYPSEDDSNSVRSQRRPTDVLPPVPANAQPILDVPQTPQAAVISTAFEPAPILYSTDLLPGMFLTGPGYRIDEGVQVVDYYGQFVLRSDVGEIKVDGAALLKLRVRELDAVRQLDEIEDSEVFGDSVVRGVKRPFEAVRMVVTEPVNTLTGLPRGVGRFIVRAARNVRDIAYDIGDGTRDAMNDDDGNRRGPRRTKSEKAQRAATSATLRYLGYSKVRRQIARNVGADPYSTNPLLIERLDHLAWVAWSGGKLTSIGLGAIGGVASDVLSYSKDAYELVWELPPEDLKRRNLEVLDEIGINGKPARDFMRNKAYTLTQQTEFVELLRLPEFAGGRHELFRLGLRAEREIHARFLIDSMRLLQASEDFGNSEALVIGSAPALRRPDGSLLVALPVDYLHWTQEMADFAWRDDLIGQRNVILVTGSLSPLARDAFSKAGWVVQEGLGVDQGTWVENARASTAAQVAVPSEMR